VLCAYNFGSKDPMLFQKHLTKIVNGKDFGLRFWLGNGSILDLA